LEQKFPAIAKAVAKLKLRSTVLDGEIVAVDENGIPRFSFFSDSKSNRLRQLCIMFLICFGVMVWTPPAKPSCGGELCWNAS
jgi:ATP-dependent DNA ligase